MIIHQRDKWHDFLSAYDYTAKLSRDRWAWEWLRRNPEFRKAAFANQGDHVAQRVTCFGIIIKKLRTAQPAAERFGLTYFPNPDHNALTADAVWSKRTYPRPVCVQVVEAEASCTDLIFQRTVEKCGITHFLDFDGNQHLLLRGAGCVLQVRVEGLSLLDRAHRKMKLVLDEIDDWQAYMDVLKRAQRIYGDDDKSEPEWTAKALQYRNALICIDAHDAGLNKWQMAEIIYGPERVADERANSGRALRDAMRRYLDKGEEMRSGGYIDLLTEFE